jgi:hypothetical protein
MTKSLYPTGPTFLSAHCTGPTFLSAHCTGPTVLCAHCTGPTVLCAYCTGLTLPQYHIHTLIRNWQKAVCNRKSRQYPRERKLLIRLFSSSRSCNQLVCSLHLSLMGSMKEDPLHACHIPDHLLSDHPARSGMPIS